MVFRFDFVLFGIGVESVTVCMVACGGAYAVPTCTWIAFEGLMCGCPLFVVKLTLRWHRAGWNSLTHAWVPVKGLIEVDAILVETYMCRVG